MKNMRKFTLIITLLVCFTGRASDLNEASLKQQIDLLSHLKNSVTRFDSVNDFDAPVETLTTNQQIILRYLWLDVLANQTHLNEAQFRWIKTLTETDLVLRGSLLDHPNSEVTLINIPESAKSALRLIDINQQEQEFERHWQNNDLDWTLWLAPQSNHYHGFINWLKMQTVEEYAQLSSQWLKLGVVQTLPDNNALLIILTKLPSIELANQLLSREVDQYTRQFIQRLPSLPLYYDGVQLLAIGLDKPALSSQTLVTLAKHYDHQHQAQDLLLSALDSDQHKWHVMAVLEKISDSGFRQRLNKRFASDSSKFAQSAMKQLSKGDLQ